MSRIAEIQAAFSSLNQNMDDVFQMRAINRANEMTNQIRGEELDEQAKIGKVRQVAEALAMDLMSVGASPDVAAKAKDNLDPTSWMRSIQTPFQAAMQGMTQQQAADYGQEQITTANKLKRDEISAAQAQAAAAFEFKRQDKIEQDRQKLNDHLNKPDELVRSSLGRLSTMNVLGKGLRTFVGAHTQKEDLDKIPIMQVQEMAPILAQMSQGGAAPTEGSIKEFMPHVLPMEAKKMVQIISGDPQAGGVGTFIQLYMTAAAREQALARDEIGQYLERQSNAYPRLTKEDAPWVINQTALAMKRPASEFKLNKAGLIEHIPSATDRRKRENLSIIAKDLFHGLKKKDPKAEAYAKKIGLNSDLVRKGTPKMLDAEFDALILLGTVPDYLGEEIDE